MTTVLFVGPTLPGAASAVGGGVLVRPPVAAGDVYDAVLRGASRVAIVDGFWGDRPSVRHKELLWALAQGVPVLGAASMGALRAAELAPFGMIGIGKVFQRYALGELTRDGDVVIAHGPEAFGYQPLGIAVVDVEARLRRGIAAHGLATPSCRVERWLDAARAVPIPERTLDRVLSALEILARPDRPPTVLMSWLRTDGFSIKRADAGRLLDRLRLPSPPPPSVAFPADMFHRRALAAARRRADAASDVEAG